MHDDFYEIYDSLLDIVKFFVFFVFCYYEFLYNFCYSCDCILIPYKNPNQSSGVIGYASLFQKPVIGPSQGLLGRLIKEYKLGDTIDNISPSCLKSAVLLTICNNRNELSRYASLHNTNTFLSVFI